MLFLRSFTCPRALFPVPPLPLCLAQDVIKEMKRRFKFMNHQIEQLKDEITIMDHSLVQLVLTNALWYLRHDVI